MQVAPAMAERTGREPTGRTLVVAAPGTATAIVRARGRRSLRAARPRVEARRSKAAARLRARVGGRRALVAERRRGEGRSRLGGPLVLPPRGGARDRLGADPRR